MRSHIPRKTAPAGAQRGSFLLEALISVLIVALGLLGLIALQARAIQNVDDAQYRAEAAYLANALLGQMWIHDPTKLVADFDAGGGGANYTEFKAWVDQRLPGANLPGNAPVVTVTQPGLTPQATDVRIRLFWQPPGEPAGSPAHQYEIVATVAGNP
jgi:type IV pilus assembly protein PilV